MSLSDLYFAYGAHMHIETLRALTGDASVVSSASLAGFRLAFSGYNPVWDGGSETLGADEHAETWGVLYRLRPLEWERLDGHMGATLEGTGAHFHYPVDVTTPSGDKLQVRTYQKSTRGEPRAPSREYLAFLLAAATARGLPATYRESLAALPVVPASYPVPKNDSKRRRLPVL
jgi:hypothetical protein